jgi:hypothetical protein
VQSVMSNVCVIYYDDCALLGEMVFTICMLLLIDCFPTGDPPTAHSSAEHHHGGLLCHCRCDMNGMCRSCCDTDEREERIWIEECVYSM